MVRFTNPANMVANPYPAHKTINPTHTTCEICDRRIMTKDWRAHKSSKAHRKIEQDLADAQKAINNPGASWGTSASNNQTTSENGCRNCGEEGHFAKDCIAQKKARGACHNCGEEGHNVRDCTKEHKAGGRGAGGGPCYNCGEEGHISRECTNERQPRSGGGAGGGGGPCYNCHEEGHMSRNCPQPKTGGGGGGGPCYNCRQEGHMSRDCPEPKAAGGGGGGNRACHNCSGEGHISRDCPEPRVMKCRNCDEVGHSAKECPKPRDWSRVKCNNCGNMGHGAKRCPEPDQPDLDQGGYGGGFGGGNHGWGVAPVVAEGGWDAADSAPAAEASWDVGGDNANFSSKAEAPAADGGW